MSRWENARLEEEGRFLRSSLRHKSFISRVSAAPHPDDWNRERNAALVNQIIPISPAVVIPRQVFDIDASSTMPVWDLCTSRNVFRNTASVRPRE